MTVPHPASPLPDDEASRLYAAYMRHLHRCPQDHITTQCPEGTRLRRAWREAQAASLRAPRTRPRTAPSTPGVPSQPPKGSTATDTERGDSSVPTDDRHGRNRP